MNEITTKAFKSGNSVALRLPKRLGILPGTEMRIREEDGRYIVEPVDRPKRKFDVDAIWGTAPWLKPLKPEDRLFEERELDWTGERLKNRE